MASSRLPPSYATQPMHLANSMNGGQQALRSRVNVEDLGILEFFPRTNALVDIIAIHGLDGHREGTWTTDDGVLWLRDFLRGDLPMARVLSFGYNAYTGDHTSISVQTMRRHAEDLAETLTRKRRGDPQRPIIFIAHNLGGIILKWALVLCHHASDGDLRSILVSTHAILFFGTPHSGLEKELIADIQEMASAYMKTTDVILNDLRANSSELENVQALYLQVSAKIETIFFYEGNMTNNPGELSVARHSAVLAGDRNAKTIVLYGDHRDMAKYGTKENPNYEKVLDHLSRCIASAPTKVQAKWEEENRIRSAVNGVPLPGQQTLSSYADQPTTDLGSMDLD